MKRGILVGTITSFALASLLVGNVNHAASAKTRVTKTPTAQSIVIALRSHGLPIGKITSYSASNDPNKLLGRPGYYISKTNFIDKRVKEPISDGIDVINGGSVEVFANVTNAKTRYIYLTTVEKSIPMLAEYDYIDRNVLLRISNDLTPKQAKQYQMTLKKVLGH